VALTSFGESPPLFAQRSRAHRPQASNRLQITADVDDKGLEKLEQMLVKYKEILKMLQ
jgi:hypothetical protein